MSFDQLVRSCLYNWLGYGNPNGRIWFIGMEEGGAEIWRHATRTLEESLQIRSQFSLAMDFRTVWEDLYGIPLEAFVNRKGAMTVWHFMGAFLLSLKGKKPTTQEIRDFVFESKLLGALHSDHFLCEYLPLPRKEHGSMGAYESIWPSVPRYQKEVGPKRFELIQQTIGQNSNVRLIVSYDRSFTEEILKYFPSLLSENWKDEQGKEYRLFQLQIFPNRSIHLLVTPFFGQGQANYDGLFMAANRVNRYL